VAKPKKSLKMKTKLLTLTALACLFVATASNAQVPSNVPTNGLAAWYSFDGNANDNSGGNNNGMVNGSILTGGKLGNPNTAYLFNGVNSTIDYTNPFLGGTQVSEFTFHALIYFNSTSNAPNIWGKTLFWGEVNFLIGSSNDIRFWWANSISGNKYSTIYSNPNAIQAGQWYDIVITFKNSSGTIYLNGLPITTNLYWNAQGGALISTTQIEASCNFAQNTGSSRMGVRFGTQQGYFGYLDGKIDEFGIWNRALTQQEITALYTSCTKPEPVTLGTSATTERCPNDQVTIKVVTPAADPSLTYQWTRNGTNMVGATTRNIAVADAAKYKVFVRSGPGVDCQRVSGLVETTAATPPTITATTPNGNAYCAGDSVLLSATGATAGYSYQWKRFGVPIAGATSPDFRATQTGNYRCEVSNAGGCIAQSNLISIVNGTSCRIMQDQSSDVSVYPNPAKNSFTVSFNDIGNEIPVSIELRNLQGQSVETRKLNGIADVQFNVSKLSPGMYMIRVMLEGGDVVEKSVVVE